MEQSHVGPLFAYRDAWTFSIGSCAHRCLFCADGGEPDWPADLNARVEEAVHRLFEGGSAKLWLFPFSDLFQRDLVRGGKVQDLLERLDDPRLEVTITTRGVPTERVIRAMSLSRTRYRIIVNCPNTSAEDQHRLEPGAEAIMSRFFAVRKMVGDTLTVTARASPLIPGLTDNVHSIGNLCALLARHEITELEVDWLVLDGTLKSRLYDQLPRQVSIKLAEVYVINEAAEKTIATAKGPFNGYGPSEAYIGDRMVLLQQVAAEEGVDLRWVPH